MSEISPKLLVVDDDPDFLDLLGGQLHREGVPFTTAESADEAWGILDSLTDLRVIVSDIKMPGMDGLEFLRRVKAKDQSIVVIMITGFNDRADEVEELGAAGLHLKPFDFVDLIAEIKKYF